MKILIIGTGNVGTALAADLSLKGNDVVVLKTSKYSNAEHYNKIKEDKAIVLRELNGEENIAKITNITDNYETAFSNKPEIIIICSQTNYHEEIIANISKYLNKSQIIILEPGYLSTAYFLKHCDKEKMPVIVEAESSPIDCRIYDSGKVGVLFKNVRNPIGIYPKSKKNEVFKILEKLNLKFTLADSVIESALHNPNLIVHTIGAIMSIPRIEYTNGEYWMYKEVFTKSVWNMVEKLDGEKMQVLAKLNLKPIRYIDICKFRNSDNLSLDSKDIFIDYANNSSPKGPNVSDSRYITEDVSQGLVLLESLGKILQVNTPICTALIDIAGACLNKNFRENGRTIEKLGNNNLKIIVEDQINEK